MLSQIAEKTDGDCQRRSSRDIGAGGEMIYEIHRYPAELIDVVHLRDSRRVVIRPVLPQDHELLAAYFRDLSANARCNRFMHPVSEPSSALLAHFTRIDYATHVGLIAETVMERRETVIGEACFARVADPQSAEFSLSVADSWQGQGLATLLLAKLEARAAEDGIRRMIGDSLAANEAMLSLARKTGFTIANRLGARGVTHFEKALAPWQESYTVVVA